MNLRVRHVTRADAAPIAAIYAPYVLHTAITFETEPPTAADMRERIQTVSATLPFLVGTVEDEVLGYAYATPHRKRAAYRWAVETSIFLHPDHHGRGMGRALYATLISELEGLGYVTAWAGIALPNPGSIALHEALGFRSIGLYETVGFKDGAWRDVAWFRRTLATPANPPEEPLRWLP